MLIIHCTGCIEFISLMVTTSRVANAETRDEPVFDINVRGKIHSVKLPCNNFAHCGKGVTNIFDFDIAKFFPDCDVPCITAPDILQAALSHPNSADPWHISTAYTTYVTCGTAITSTVNAPFNRWVQGAGRQVLGVPKH